MNVYLNSYWQRKQLEQLIKLKHSDLFNALELARVRNLKDKIERINYRDNGSIENWLEVRGQDHHKNIKKELVKGFWAALTQDPENMKIIFATFELPHKSFWRIVFAMRHIKDFQFSYCTIADIKHISDQFHIDLWGIFKFGICSSNIIVADGAFYKLME